MRDTGKLILNKPKHVNSSLHMIEKDFNLNYQPKTINLYTTWYDESNEKRKAELLKCLKRNIENDSIKNILILMEMTEEKVTDRPELQSDKIQLVYIPQRPKYSDFFNLISTFTTKDEINIIANTDIYFDNSINLLKKAKMDKVCFALTRYNVLENKQVEYYDRKDSQDVWVFKGQVENVNGDFCIGMPGCDNRIAWEIKQAGYNICNPSLSIHSYHLHLSNIRNYTDDPALRVPKPYLKLEKCEIDSFLIKNNCPNILHIGLSMEFQKSMCKALGELGNYYQIDWREEIDKTNYKAFTEKLIRIVEEIEPVLIFMQLQTPDIITQKLIDKITEIVPKVKIINWNGDIRDRVPEWMIELAKNNHVYTAFSNMRDVNTMLELGYSNTFFVQIGFEESVFNKDVAVNKFSPWITFTGGLYSQFPLYNLRMEMIRRMRAEYGDKFMAYGTGMPEFGCSYSLPKTKTAILYKSSDICLSVNNFDAELYTSDRLFNILAVGGFCLAHYYKGIEKDFVNKEHLVWWHDIDELMQLTEYYLNSPIERAEIAYNGCRHVWENHRWKNRVNYFKETIKLKGIEL